MRLFLASEAKNELTIPKLHDYIGDFKTKRVAYIPTAKNGQFYGWWKASDTPTWLASKFANLQIVELESCHHIPIDTQLSDVDVLWVAGGMVGYLAYWMRRSGLDKLLPDLFDKGIVYVGSSAGSMVCSQTLKLADRYIGESEPGASLIPGLGLIDFEIYPHYQDELYPQIQKLWTPDLGKLYLLKDGEAITVENNKITVLGEERIINK